jgi:hypothetical protein
MLFSERSIWTMIHGIGLGGGALLALTAALVAFYLLQPRNGEYVSIDGTRLLARITAFAALWLWLTTIAGTYVVFPPYRATPPEGSTDLSEYPRAMILADPSTAWLHRFAMETKEHLPIIASMLATAAAFVVWRYRDRLFAHAVLRRLAAATLAASFVIVAYVSLLGVFVNKVAPLE